MTIQKLINRSYVPYSKQPAACILQSQEGHFFPGVRIENASFPLTISAVQNAVFNCIASAEHPDTVFVENPQSHLHTYWKDEYDLTFRPLTQLDNFTVSAPLLSLEENSIRPTLQSLLDNAHIPYSNYPVSALLETDEGFISGINIELSEWGYGLCAERVALARALAYGFTDFKNIFIHTKHGSFTSPCGACRQVMYEHLPDQKVHLYHANHTYSSIFVNELLPYGFHASELNN